MLTEAQQRYSYQWPPADLSESSEWERTPGGMLARSMPESLDAVQQDSRWPAFFPSPICFVTTGDGETSAVEKVVGASVVNRFPYVVALSFCRDDLSDRHYARRGFCDLLEQSGGAAVQFVSPGPTVDALMDVVNRIPDEDTTTRVAASGVPTRPGKTNPALVFEPSYMVYEATLMKPCDDFLGAAIYEQPWTDVGSHRVYFLEINAIQLREDVARGERQIKWRSLPAAPEASSLLSKPYDRVDTGRYQKGYQANYSFPSPNTSAFEADAHADGMAIKYLTRDIEFDNDKARWPCFFPQSAGMITTRGADGSVNVMPCGSTTVVSRHPMIISPCISYAQINERYGARTSLDLIMSSGRFGVGVPYIDEVVLDAIRYAGNTSLRDDPRKIVNLGMDVDEGEFVPILPELPITYECEVVGSATLGTHVMFFGEVRRILVSPSAEMQNALEWCPWADIVDHGQTASPV
jgi:flavin reductase (DIM6/NTAB) family NADH-FMN oxidoreductase RutF